MESIRSISVIFVFILFSNLFSAENKSFDVINKSENFTKLNYSESDSFVNLKNKLTEHINNTSEFIGNISLPSHTTFYQIEDNEDLNVSYVVHGSYNMLKHGCKLVSWKFTDMDYKDCKKTLEKRSFQIEKEKVWVKKPSMLCQWCDFKSICQDSWSEE